MQKQEIDNTRLFFYITMPIIGWLVCAYILNVPLTPFLKAVPLAIKATSHNIGLIAGIVLGIISAIAISSLCKEYGDDGFRGSPYYRWLRGAKLENWHNVKQKIILANLKVNRARRKAKLKKLEAIMIGEMPMPIHLENRNLLICASIGAGKSVAIESQINSALKRGDKMALLDPNGTFYSKFSSSKDIILNPFDTRSVGWSIFNEVNNVHDFDRMAKSVIPPRVDASDEQWCSYARDVLADSMRKLHESGNSSQDKLVDLLLREDGDVIKSFLANTDSKGYFRDNAEKATASVQFLMNKYVRPLRHMSRGDFSLQEWVHDPDAGNLFITWREDMRTAQRPLVAMWIDTICSTILSNLSDNNNHDSRLWLFLDELESLGKLESFVPAATKGRKHGLRIVASIQDWAQLDETYGRDSARTLLACFRNYLIFGASNAYSADKASQILGSQHVLRRQITTNTGKGGNKSKNLVSSPSEPVVTNAEIANLKDLTGYVMFAEDFPIAKINLPYKTYQHRAQALCIKYG